MPAWVTYSILGAAVFTVVNFIDKYILERQIRDYRGMAIYSSVAAFIAGVLFWVATGFPILGFSDTVLVLLSGAFTIWGAAIYFQVMVSEEASKVIFLMQIVPIFVLILGYIFLKEVITFKQLVGFIAILVATTTVSADKNSGLSLKANRTLILMLAADLLFAISSILFKFVVNTNDFAKLISYEGLGYAVGGICLYLFFPSIRRAFLKTNSTLKKTGLAVIFGNEAVFIISKVINFFAVSLGPVALVGVLGGTQVFFAVIYGWILTLTAPKIFKENISGKELLRKFWWAAVTFGGIILIG